MLIFLCVIFCFCFNDGSWSYFDTCSWNCLIIVTVVKLILFLLYDICTLYQLWLCSLSVQHVCVNCIYFIKCCCIMASNKSACGHVYVILLANSKTCGMFPETNYYICFTKLYVRHVDNCRRVICSSQQNF